MGMAAQNPDQGYHRGQEAEKRLKRRYAAEGRFRAFCLFAVFLALAALVWLLSTILGTGYTVFRQHNIDLEVTLAEDVADPGGTRDPAVIRAQSYKPVIFDALIARFPELTQSIADMDRLVAENEAFAERSRERVRELRAERAELGDELLALVDEDEAEEILIDFVLDDLNRVGKVAEVTLPASPLLARYARSNGADTAGMSESQRKIAASLLRRGRIDAAGDEPTVRVEIDFAEYILDPRGLRYEEDIEEADFGRLLARSLAPYDITVSTAFFVLEDGVIAAEENRANAQSAARQMRRRQIELRDEILEIVSESGAENMVRQMAADDPGLIGRTLTINVPVSDDVDQYLKGYVDTDVPVERRAISPQQAEWIGRLVETGEIHADFNTIFFTAGDSQDPELAGIASALMGTLLTLIVTFVLSFPIGVAAAIYLEEFAPKNRWTDLIEVNINNLAAVPSIVFGLLGLAVFLNVFGLPRSAPLVGGMVLALMTLPTIIIASRAALKAVPPSIREGALGIGASPVQSVFHHVLPLAMPGILTGSILGMAQALGETAPLLMIGMVAFITEVPDGFLDSATALPVQIYQWALRSQPAFAEERSAGAIIVLLVFLILMNVIAVFLRRRFERRW